MGCDGLGSEDLATDFDERGAVVYVDWDEPVSLSYTDRVVLGLLEALTVRRLALGDAMAYADGLFSPEPCYKSTLRVKPDGAARVGVGRWAR